MNENLTPQIVAALLQDGTIKMTGEEIATAIADAVGGLEKQYRFRGVATPGAVPGKIFEPTLYVAVASATYGPFSNQSVDKGQIVFLTSDNGAYWDATIAYCGGNGCEPEPTPPGPPTPGPDLSEPLTFEAKEDNTPIIAMSQSEGEKTLLYSVDNGATWESETIGQAPAMLATLNTGETIQFKGDNFCPGGMIIAVDLSGGEPTFKPFYAYGNMMSLLSAENFESLTEVTAGCFQGFFSLGGPTLYLKSDHRLLLPATTLAEDCYHGMFSGCTSLAAAPELPATTLAEDCYHSMFSGCTSLAAAPELPATTLASQCYQSMFENCTNLSEVKCYAEDISAQGCVFSWLNDVAATGTFTKAAGVNWPTGADGIPTGWTVIEA